MFGLDKQFIDKMDSEVAISRIAHDINSDFIFAPHYNAIFENASENLWKELKAQLNGGKYNPLLPITIEVPKKSGLTRPGAILNPIDMMAFEIEKSIDRNKVFSNEFNIQKILAGGDPSKMFVPVSEKYSELRIKLIEYCSNENYDFAITADIACYFERIYQHVLINLLRSSNIEPELVSILEKVLSAHTAKDSHGIVQGMYPSDILGNFYLIAFDAYLQSRKIEFIRFVDDYWMFFPNKRLATRSLADICNYVRKEGLYLNEQKTRIIGTEKLHYEETEIDRLFDEAKDELESMEFNTYEYNFDPFEIEEIATDIELIALEKLYKKRFEKPKLIDKIDKFCLPRFAIARSAIAVEDALEGLITHPHLTNIYIRYLKAFIAGDGKVINKLKEYFLRDQLNYDWQVMWVLGLFYSLDTLSKDIVTQAYSMLENNNKSQVLRSICALISSKHGDGAIKRLVRNRYASEPSSYVKEAILYSTKHFPSSDDRSACINAWEGHSETNKLIVIAMKNEAKKAR